MKEQNNGSPVFKEIITVKEGGSFSKGLVANVHARPPYVGANYHPHDDKNPEKIKKLQALHEIHF